MRYLNRLLSKWMPPSSPTVAVDSHPRLSGILDTVNSTLAHGPATRLPPEFYDRKARRILDRIGVEEWFAGYKESREFRMLGVGGLLGDVVERMVGVAEGSRSVIKFSLSGCHDTTLAGILQSVGAFDGKGWPPYTSHIAIEMFYKPEQAAVGSSVGLRQIFAPASRPIGRRPLSDLSPAQRAKMKGYYVRIRYNDRVMVVPACRRQGKHLDGDESFCTLDAFKAIVDDFTPVNWKRQCLANLDKPAFPAVPGSEDAGTTGSEQ
jgi:acid phosphatase